MCDEIGINWRFFNGDSQEKLTEHRDDRDYAEIQPTTTESVAADCTYATIEAILPTELERSRVIWISLPMRARHSCRSYVSCTKTACFNLAIICSRHNIATLDTWSVVPSHTSNVSTSLSCTWPTKDLSSRQQRCCCYIRVLTERSGLVVLNHRPNGIAIILGRDILAPERN